MTDTMTDGPTGGPRWAGPPSPIDGLRRSETDRWMAGVAGGIARHFDVTPWIVRLVGLILAVVGVGVPLYILGWLLLPSDSRPSVATERGWNRNTVIAVCVLVVLASIVVLGSDGVSPPWRALPWLIIALGAFLLIRSTTSHSDLGPGGPPAPPAPGTIDVTTSDAGASGTGPDPSGPTTAQAATATPGFSRPAAPPTATAGPPPPPRPRRTPFLTPLSLFGLVGLVGAAILAGGHGWARPGVVAAIALCGIGGVLVLSAFAGRARGLVVVGVAVTVPLLIGLAIGPRWNDWHNRTYRPTDTSQLHRTYDRGIGRTVLDLRDLRLPAGRTTVVTVHQAIGQVEVWLPPDSTTGIMGHVSFGDVEIDAQAFHDDSGTDVDVNRTLVTGDGAARLHLHLQLGAGQLRIRGDDAVPRGAVPTAPSVPAAPTTLAPTTPTTPTIPVGGN